MTTGVVIGCILFACDQLFRVEKLAVGSSAYFIWGGKWTFLYLSLLKLKKEPQWREKLTDDCWLQVNKDSSGNMFTSSSLTEKRVEGVISTPNSFVAGHLAVRLNAVLQTVKFPAGITHLDSGLAHMH